MAWLGAVALAVSASVIAGDRSHEWAGCSGHQHGARQTGRGGRAGMRPDQISEDEADNPRMMWESLTGVRI